MGHETHLGRDACEAVHINLSPPQMGAMCEDVLHNVHALTKMAVRMFLSKSAHSFWLNFVSIGHIHMHISKMPLLSYVFDIVSRLVSCNISNTSDLPHVSFKINRAMVGFFFPLTTK